MKTVNVNMKFKGMRKEQNFTIYPVLKTDTVFLIQSDKKIGRVDLEKKRILISKTISSGAYAPHLYPSMGAKFLDLSNEEIEILTDARNRMADNTNQKDRTITLVG
jgi:hypothetical protein